MGWTIWLGLLLKALEWLLPRILAKSAAREKLDPRTARKLNKANRLASDLRHASQQIGCVIGGPEED